MKEPSEKSLELDVQNFLKEQIEKSHRAVKKTKSEVVEKITTLMIAAFGLVAALAWNDAIKAIFTRLFGEQSTLWRLLGYAVLITLIAVLATIWISKVSEKLK